MTPELLALAKDVDKLWRRNNGSTREQAARIGILDSARLARLLAEVDAVEVADNAMFLSHLDDAVRIALIVPTLHVQWWRRGITEEVATRMVEDRRAGRQVALPLWESKAADVKRMAAYLERVRPRFEAEAQVARGAAAAKDEADRKAKADRATEMAVEDDGDALAALAAEIA